MILFSVIPTRDVSWFYHIAEFQAQKSRQGWRLRLLTEKEKAWFFLLCNYQPKINKLIFLIFNEVISSYPVSG
jgi:hypothetical protein